MILLLDNYDSFAANLARYFERMGERVASVRSDRIGLDEIEALAPEAIILSPGPCGPDEAGVSLGCVRRFSGRVPILGVCLGHQVIGAAFGGAVGPALSPMHGLASPLRHVGNGLFAGLPEPMEVGRYHSLIVRATGEMERALRVTAWSDEGEVMGLQHVAHPTYGIQFHPESVLTPDGARLLGNFRTMIGRKRVESPNPGPPDA